MNKNIITSEVVLAYSQCPRKAFLLLFTEDKGTLPEYIRILEQRKIRNREEYITRIKQNNSLVKLYDIKTLNRNIDFLIEASLSVNGLEAYCDVLIKGQSTSSLEKYSYEPAITVGTYSLSREHKIELLFIGYILEQIQNQPTKYGIIISMGGEVHKLKLTNSYKMLRLLIEPLREWIQRPPVEPPPVILNKHCPTCQFQTLCREKAEQENNLSLLDRISPKAIYKYNRRGIFTIHQLSYLFKPRKSKKKGKITKSYLKDNLELQALAIRENKIYVQVLPEVSRKKMELFLDIEGIPDEHFHYLIGLLVCQESACVYHSFWADTIDDEEKIWNSLVSYINEYPEAPIYHYGSYEPRAINELSRKYSTDVEAIQKRLVNINSYIYGKIYFPVLSNNLKKIGNFIGASWECKDASGLQSLVWRYEWEEVQSDKYKKLLIKYNYDDCNALKLLYEKISLFRDTIGLDVIFPDYIKNNLTENGIEVHEQFKEILKFAYISYDKSKIKFQRNEPKSSKQRKISIGYQRLIPKAGRIVHLTAQQSCLNCGKSLENLNKTAEKTVINLVFTKNGIRKSVIKFSGAISYCRACNIRYYPKEINKRGNQLFGHAFQSWIVYQRLVLRLSYKNIVNLMEEQFNEKVSLTTVTECIKSFAFNYYDTEKIIHQHILDSPFIHVDETTISIRGVDQYVWVFTTNKHVIFKLTNTREANIVHELLANYNGILVSDFYAGYDSVQCRQQKCWVHLIRNLNDDLLQSPFDAEFEIFILEVKNLILPIFETIERYGFKSRYLKKYKKNIDYFYLNFINDKFYHSELVMKYQKRFIRYQEKLFIFMEEDGIAWHNNMAESAIRHFTKQRDISGSFFESFTHSYLTMLGITQTCKFQGKSLLKFLLSGEKDIDTFKQKRNIKNSKIVGLHKNNKDI
ncbi:TM0106 family RecB-like putative nuclease [Nostoc flagelliforme]|uniref:TM0106 family RecB-like putative nuclease n=1 Tax=Nostoc flagelliforme TaxID=1306274 RepID=UPI001F54A2BD|nr:TM0106 family RecB-like putative nuclease [Nostoc flagelliforme]